MQKKRGILILMAMLLVMFTACGGELISTTDIYKANQLGPLLEKYDSVLFSDEGASFSETLYFSKAEKYLGYEEYELLFLEDADWEYQYADDSLIKRWYAMSEQEEKKKREEQNNILIVSPQITTEKVLQLTDNGDGTTTVETVLDKQNTEKMIASSFPELAEEYASAEMKSTYVVKTDTKELISAVQVFSAKGKELKVLEAKEEYNAEKPEGLQKLLEGIVAYQERAQNIQTKKFIQVIYDAGTKQEEIFEYLTDNDCLVAPIARDGYEIDFENGFTKTTDDDGTVHITILANKVK